MSKHEKNEQEKNELEKNIDAIREWQDNQYNPDYHIGSGRVARPIRSLSRFPIILIIFGEIGFDISIITFVSYGISYCSIISIILGLIISFC